ncbi:glycosyl hydrolase family 28-related protein [Paenibacillus elgii]|uniref:glycosyl hydrolase family 28-related protein n=1 Tax=Paenibacillus elgii TaxID=189691 RepID=UPI000584C473|nr:glycosyl hydrolase family 28-related protein [Paenibacillus elgii]
MSNDLSRRKFVASMVGAGIGLTGLSTILSRHSHAEGQSVTNSVYSGNTLENTSTGISTEVAKISRKLKNIRVDVIEDYEAKGDGKTDDYAAIQLAIDDVYKKGGGEVFFPKPTKKYRIGTTLKVKDNVSLAGVGEGPDGSVLFYVGTDWAIKTDEAHQRNKFKDIRLELNGTSNGVKIGDIKNNLKEEKIGDAINKLIPTIFEFDNFTVTDVKSGFTAYEFNNASHITMRRSRSGYGRNHSGGNGLRIYADGGINSGVFSATDCVFGRVDHTDVALEITGTSNLDSYTFDSCYFGGQQIKIGEKTHVRSVNFLGCHGEFRLLDKNSKAEIEAVQLYRVRGGSWIGGTITCFGAANSNAFVFKEDVKKFNIEGVEANAIMKSIFKQDEGKTVEGCILQEADLTNDSDAVQFVGVSDHNFKFGTKEFRTEEINAKFLSAEDIKSKFLRSVDGTNKMDWGSKHPKNDSPTLNWTIGDYRHNTLPKEEGNVGSKYVLNGWKCIASGNPGVWVEDRGLTGN